MEWYQLYAILAVVVVVGGGGIYLLRKKFKGQASEQADLLNQNKVTTSILILEKRKDRVFNANMPKAVLEKIPKVYKVKKVPIVKAKIGHQVMDLLCDEKVFPLLPEKKSVRVELAGIYIAGIKAGKK